MRLRIALGLLILPAALAFSSARGSTACTSGRVMGVRSEFFILATARADTVRTGPGPIRYTVPDELGRDPATVHGQRFRLDRAGGDVPPELASLAAGVPVILVSYGNECREVWRWWESARWTAPGMQRFAAVQLRAPAEWIGGQPTFDLDPDDDSYPYWEPDRDDGPPLTAAEMFEMESTLPTWEEAESAPRTAYARFLRWAETHPHLAARSPADAAMVSAQHAMQR